MRRYVEFNEVADIALKKMTSAGVLLTSKCDGRINTMTIGWGGINYYWKMPIFEAPVRFSRHTHDMIEKSGAFTVSVPLDNDEDAKKILVFCGTNSGRDIDKFEALGLKAADGEAVNVPVVSNFSLHFECEVVYKFDMTGENLNAAINERWYPDYHTVFFGKIVKCYIDEK